MTITELIKRLEYDLSDMGDVDVLYFDNNEGFVDLSEDDFSSTHSEGEAKLVIT